MAGKTTPETPRAARRTNFFQRRRNQLVLVALAIAAFVVVPLALGTTTPPDDHKLSVLLGAVDKNTRGHKSVASAVLDDDERVIELTLNTGQKVSASYPALFGGELVSRLEKAGVPFETRKIQHESPVGALAMSLLPLGLIAGIFVYMSKKGSLGADPSGAKAFTGTKAEVEHIPAARFTDVVGCDEAVEELAEIVAFLHDASHFEAAGARMPRGFLLVGPPGTGKTLLARAVAGEAGVPFYSAAGSDFAEMFVGVGAARVRDLFTKAKKTGGIVFIDELDSVGRARNGNMPGGGTSEERESTLNALLVEIDGFDAQDNVVVMAATNRADVLDPALLRAGRFDRQVTVAPPDRRGRSRLLELYVRDRRVDSDIDFVALARRTPGLTGADIANLVNQAALEAARHRREVLTAADFDEALATVVMGRARKSAVVTDQDRQITAWHEAGHTVAALVLPHAHDPVQVTIVPRGVAGGVTWMGGDDHSFMTRSQARARLTVALSGRAAEELLLDGDFTQGASGDLASATDLAMRMVVQWGMSSLGLAALDPERTGVGLSERIHAEVDGMLAQALEEARTVVREHRALLETVVAELLDEETIDLDRLKQLQLKLAA